MTLNKLERFQEAIESFNNAIKLNPNYVVAYDCKGKMIFNKNQHKLS